jgi:murein DD-endopeptidase MepM/ murein hydrolase activator NlpD
MALSSALLRDTFKSSPLDETIVSLRRSTISTRKSSIKAIKVFQKKKLVGDRINQKERRLNQLFRFRNERRSREDILEANKSSGGGIAARALDKGKGFLGRIMNALGYLLLGWLTTQLPKILAFIDTLKYRIGNIINAGKRMLQDVRNIVVGIKGVVSQGIANIKNFDFTDKEGKLQKEIDGLNESFDSLGKNFDDAVDNVKNITTPKPEPEFQGPGGDPSGSGKGQAQQRPSQSTTESTPATPSTSGSTSGGNYSSRLQPIHRQALDKISEYESAAAGNYNAMNQGTVPDRAGRRPYSGPSKGGIGKDLTNMTIAEVLQSQNKKLGNNQGFIHAAGRYQFLKGTLESVLRYAGISDKVKFSPDVQDYLAAVLLTMPGGGLSHWTADKRTGLLKDQAGMDLINKAAQTPLGKAPPVVQSPQPTVVPSPSPAQPQQKPRPAPASTGLTSLKGTTGSAYAPQGRGASVSIPTSPISQGRKGGAVITSGMGQRDLGKGLKQHSGIDIGARRGTPLYSYLPGKVHQTGKLGASNDGGYGNWVTWKDDKFNAYHFFGHMNTQSPLRPGSKFGSKTMLGTVGGSGFGNPNEYTDHLHWEISNLTPDSMGNFRAPSDPITWMNKNFTDSGNVKPVNVSYNIPRGQRKRNGPLITYIPVPIEKPTPIPTGGSMSSGSSRGTSLNSIVTDVSTAYT